jgi:hypothetical protein
MTKYQKKACKILGKHLFILLEWAKTVQLPGFARTRWGSSQHSSIPLACWIQEREGEHGCKLSRGPSYFRPGGNASCSCSLCCSNKIRNIHSCLFNFAYARTLQMLCKNQCKTEIFGSNADRPLVWGVGKPPSQTKASNSVCIYIARHKMYGKSWRVYTSCLAKIYWCAVGT